MNGHSYQNKLLDKVIRELQTIPKRIRNSPVWCEVQDICSVLDNIVELQDICEVVEKISEVLDKICEVLDKMCLHTNPHKPRSVAIFEVFKIICEVLEKIRKTNQDYLSVRPGVSKYGCVICVPRYTHTHRMLDSHIIDTNKDQAEKLFLVFEKIGVKDARKMIAQIQRDDAEIKQLTESMKTEMVLSISGDYNISVMVPKISLEVNDPTEKLLTKPFFLEKYRYQLCLQVSIGSSGGSLSVFVHIMKGDFDSILDWPFVHKVAIKVKNQKEGDAIVHIVQPDSTGIQRPEVDQNITFGSRNFPTYSELLTAGFVRDGCISIECEVLWN